MRVQTVWAYMDTTYTRETRAMPQVQDEEVAMNCPRATEAIDYPCSWDFWRNACIYYDRYDPGPCEPEQTIVEDDASYLLHEEAILRQEPKSGVNNERELAILKGKVNFLMREREGKRVTKKAKGSIPL